mmetsp:Transcript_14223/g.34301  ORF Transcript_14223/g.34301 Transcript_14223/m.34301 type:complete len:477 (+) Transcript_14223:86-1516(+)
MDEGKMDMDQDRSRLYAQRLALGGALADRVLDVWSSSMKTSSHHYQRYRPFSSMNDQDGFAQLILDECERCGCSIRYIKHLAKTYARRIEQQREQDHLEEREDLESDLLSEWIFRMSLQKETFPSEDESCILSFALPEPGQVHHGQQHRHQQPLPPQVDHLLRIRVYPYHNDVALRLWEAGGCLAEYFIQNPQLISSKHVVELGAGVGLTGIAISAICHPASMYLTDYTDVCRRNLQHNLDLNHDLLEQRYNFDPSLISQGYLEWNEFVETYRTVAYDRSAAKQAAGRKDKEQPLLHKEQQHSEPSRSSNVSNGTVVVPAAFDAILEVTDAEIATTLRAFQRGDLLIAADVIYDTAVIDSLVRVVRNFLASKASHHRHPSDEDSSPNTAFICDNDTTTTNSLQHHQQQKKVAIFAITRRNMNSFHLLLDRLSVHGIHCTWLADGVDCDALPRLIESTFVQPRKDVQIAKLAVDEEC